MKNKFGQQWQGSKDALKTARELNAPFVPEIHMVGGERGAQDAIGELLKACGWVVIYEPSPKAGRKQKHDTNKKLEKGASRRVQPRQPGKSARVKGRSKIR